MHQTLSDDQVFHGQRAVWSPRMGEGLYQVIQRDQVFHQMTAAALLPAVCGGAAAVSDVTPLSCQADLTRHCSKGFLAVGSPPGLRPHPGRQLPGGWSMRPALLLVLSGK